MKSGMTTDADKAAQWVRDISKQIPYAISLSMNDLAFQARTNAKKDIERVFKTPTGYTKSAVQIKKSNKHTLTTLIGIGSGVRTGKKGDPRTKYLAASIFGGSRGSKRIENTLFRGLNSGDSNKMWMPAKGEKLNKFGNMTRARQKAIAKGVVNKGTARQNKKFFVKGKGQRKVIYERYGRGYKNIKTVAILFNRAKYKKQFKFYEPVMDLYKKKFDNTFHIQWNYLIRKEGLSQKGMMVSTGVRVK